MSSKNVDDQDLNETELSDLLESSFNGFCDIYKDKEQQSNVENVELNKTDPPFDAHIANMSQFASLFESDNELKENWSQLIKSCNDPLPQDDEFRDSLFKTLKTISDKAEAISGEEGIVSEEEIAKMFANMAELEKEACSSNSQDANSAELNNIMPLMSNIMQNLLSKEFLYPTLSDLNLKFEDYLEKNKDKLPESDYDRYTKQFSIIQKICNEFDSEDKDDTDQVKSDRFNRILSMMQTMQSYGTPPPELVNTNPFNPDALNELDGLKNLSNNKCTLM